MNVKSLRTRARTLVTDSFSAFCEARDGHRGTAWERLSVAYPNPQEALKALEFFRATRLPIAASAA